ncbi:YbbR domain-containing protein [Peptoniphilus olsenii]|uniref:YbbR domain-containing protein n=2 Tax=Peptoniphilus olsenii TaxID=411570 RepID=A0ABV2J765_9FIRM
MKIMKIKKDRDFMLKVLSLLFAIILWSYVRSDGNIIITRNFKNIDVTFEGQEELKNNNLTIISPKEFSVDVELKGYNSYMRTASRDGISAKVILNNLTEGDHSVPISVSYIDSGITVSKVSQKTIPFKIDKIVSDNFNASIIINSNPSPGYSVGDVENFENVKVTGASTIVNKVEKLEVNVDVSKLTETASVNSKVTAYDTNGNIIDDLIIEPSTIKVKVPILKTKTLPIVIEYTNSDSENIAISDFTIEPSSVTIRGNSNLVDSLDKISTYPIDLADTEIGINEVNLKLPDKVDLVDGIDKVKLIRKQQ